MTPEQIKRLDRKLAEARDDLAYVDRREYIPPHFREDMRQSAKEELEFYEEVLAMLQREGRNNGKQISDQD